MMFGRRAKPLADPRHFLPIPDVRAWYPSLGFSGRPYLVTQGEPVLATDPIYLADVYNPNDDPVAKHIRSEGVIVNDFGGDSSGPVWWKDPFLVMPMSNHADLRLPRGAMLIANEVGCDSASFVFLPVRIDTPAAVLAKIREVVEQQSGKLLNLPPGQYTFWLEQFEGYRQANMAGLYRNIVAERKPPDVTVEL